MSLVRKFKEKIGIANIMFGVIVVALLGWIIIEFFFPFLTRYIRKYNIEKDLESVYVNSNIVSVECDSEPVDKAELEKRFVWYGDELPEDDLYAFTVCDSESNVGRGYATEYGHVVFDSYVGIYYALDAIEYYKEIVDFDINFQGLHYYIPEVNTINGCRVVYTHDCKTFEGYLSARTIGYFYFGSDGYPGLMVGLDDVSMENIESINQLLEAADFEFYVLYCEVEGDWADEESLCLRDFCGYYHPFDDTYEESVLGK